MHDAGWDQGERGCCAAQGAWLETAAGGNGLTAGDAALAFDPIAAQGLFNALYLGLAAGEAADRWFDGEDVALSEYAAEIGRIRDTYVNHRAAFLAPPANASVRSKRRAVQLRLRMTVGRSTLCRISLPTDAASAS
ncbi:NAD(P)/FAD-dependent oxidoreductase [Bradyrhizobium sp. USDA 3315]